MFFWLRNRIPPDDPLVLRLRPPAGFGDHLMLSAVLEGLKAEKPEYRVYLAAYHPDIFLHNPHVEDTLDEHRLKKKQPELLETYRRIRFRFPEDRYLQVSGHLIDDMYGMLGIPLKERPRQPRIYLTPRESEFGGEVERLSRPRVAIVPHGKSGVKLPNKIYPADQWEELGRLLVRTGWSILQLGARKEGPLVEGAHDFRDLGYRKSAAVLRRCDLLVTHVGGLMHLAAALRVPAVVLYGATEHPNISGYPWNRNLYVPIECGPCWMTEPCDHHTCMRRLTPEYALEEIRAALRDLPRPDPPTP